MTHNACENQMPDNAEACRLPCLHEQIHLVPSIEAYAKAAVLQNAVHLVEAGRRQRPLSSLATARPCRSRNRVT